MSPRELTVGDLAALVARGVRLNAARVTATGIVVRALARRTARAVSWAHELTGDAVRLGVDTGRDADGFTRGEAAEIEWHGAVVAFLRWGLS